MTAATRTPLPRHEELARNFTKSAEGMYNDYSELPESTQRAIDWIIAQEGGAK